MVSTAMVSLPTNRTSPQCGLRLGVAGKCCFYLLIPLSFRCYCDIHNHFSTHIQKVYWVWWSFSSTTSSRFGFCSCSFYTEGWLIYQLLHGWYIVWLAYAGIRFHFIVITSGLLMQYHGGTNFGRTAGGPFITTSYDYDAPLDEYGQNPKTYSFCIGIFWYLLLFLFFRDRIYSMQFVSTSLLTKAMFCTIWRN